MRPRPQRCLANGSLTTLRDTPATCRYSFRVQTHPQRGVLVALSLFAIAACSDDDPRRTVANGQSCDTDADCTGGLCVGATCLDPDGDPDGDGLTSSLENDLGSSPFNRDTDADGVLDPDELTPSQSNRDSDGDGIPDVIESALADADGDCRSDELDAENLVPNPLSASTKPAQCLSEGVCADNVELVILVCPTDLSTPDCDYSALVDWSVDDVCDGLDNDCDGSIDEDCGVVPASCSDGAHNASETDVDCGGLCGPCGIGAGCDSGTDCGSGVCLEGICQAPACDDGVFNGPETDRDCGGDCPACPIGGRCSTSADCRTRNCNGAGLCMALGPIAAGAEHTCAHRDTGVWCWGQSDAGQLGAGWPTNGVPFTPGMLGPVDVGDTVVQLASGGSHSCALRLDGSVVCWGRGASGQLGYASRAMVGDDETPAAQGPVELGGSALLLAAGDQHTCALLTDYRVRCWGEGVAVGYLDEVDVGAVTSPGDVGDVYVGGLTVQIVAGRRHTCALLWDGDVVCWGEASSGQLGYGSTEAVGDDDHPANAGNVPLGAAAVELAAGDDHTCAVLQGGRVRCWGANSFGQLGTASTEPVGDDETPAERGDVLIGGLAASVVAGAAHTCVLLVDGRVRCWGRGLDGELGPAVAGVVGDDETPATAAVVPLGAVDIDHISAGGRHTCAHLVGGGLRCWGAGALGIDGAPTESELGVDVALGCSDDNDCASSHCDGGTCAPTSCTDGVTNGIEVGVDCGVGCGLCGLGSACGGSEDCAQGVCSAGVCAASSCVDGVRNGLETAIDCGGGCDGCPSRVACSVDADCAGGPCVADICQPESCDDGVLSAGETGVDCGGADCQRCPAGATCFGNDDCLGGRCGSDGRCRDAASVAAGRDHTCAVVAGGVTCWGSGAGGALGLGGEANSGEQMPIAPLPNVDVDPAPVALAAGGDGTCLLDDTGFVTCWGHGDLSAGGEMVALDGPAAAVGVGARFGCALLAAGDIACWGESDFGVLGADSEVSRASPVTVYAGGATQLAVGRHHICAVLDSPRALRCWGRGNHGELGTASTATSESTATTALQLPTPIRQLALGDAFSCALTTDGRVTCWGDNTYGQLGLGVGAAIGDDELPGLHTVAIDARFVQITAGAEHVCGLTGAGAVHCWGRGADGRLGSGSVADSGRATQPRLGAAVDLGAVAFEVRAGARHTCAKLLSGAVTCWGAGADGRLGYPATEPVGDEAGELPAPSVPL